VAVPATGAAKLPPLPAHWTHRVELGLTDQPGGAKALHKSIPKLRFRYQYLAGGVNTGDGWRTWNENGTFVDRYIGETEKNHLVPVFSYYMIRQSLPGSGDTDEPHAVLSNLRNPSTMKAWLGDIRAFLKHAGRFPDTTVVLQVEPDMWGYGEQAANGDDAATVQVSQVGSLAGLAQRVVKLRNQLAPNVLLAYHASGWGTGVDISIQNPSLSDTTKLGRKAGRYYRSLHARFDLTFTDWSDRDAGFKQDQYGAGPEAWWDGADRKRAVRFLNAYSHRARQRVAVWQIPLGNTMLDDTWGRYRDNHVQWLLGKHSRKHLRTLAKAGAVAFLFGGGADGTTSADTDGGYFRRRANHYYGKPLRLP
jgi:hypothetical protein